MSLNAIRRVGLSVLIGTFAFGMVAHATPNEDTYRTINNEGIVLKDAPSSEAASTRELQKDEVIRIGEQVDDYVEVILDFGMVAYVEAHQVEEKAVPKPEPKKDRAQEVVEFAKKYVGNPYRYGGTSLTNGADCSGFTSQVFKNFGVSIPRTSGAQYSGAGTRVSKSNLQAGDLVFYGYSGRVNHVAIYIGNNKIVHAGSSRTGIYISPLEQRGMAPYMGAKRVI